MERDRTMKKINYRCKLKQDVQKFKCFVICMAMLGIVMIVALAMVENM